MIHGRVRSGQGGASKAMVGDRLRERSEVAGVELVPGTLNVHVDDLEGAVEALGEPWALSDQDNEKLGPLRWWPVWLSVEGGFDGATRPLAAAWVVRHEKTGTRYLEIVSDTNFRAAGLQDGEIVTVGPR